MKEEVDKVYIGQFEEEYFNSLENETETSMVEQPLFYGECHSNSRPTKKFKKNREAVTKKKAIKKANKLLKSSSTANKKQIIANLKRKIRIAQNYK